MQNITNGHVARESRQRVAKENAANRAQRSDEQQIEWLIRNGYNAKKEIARLTARIEKAEAKAKSKKEKRSGDASAETQTPEANQTPSAE